MPRNTSVEAAVRQALDAIDGFIAGDPVDLPSKQVRELLDAHLQKQKNSVKLATLFLAFYSMEDRAWDANSVPVGIRGANGDKLLAAELTFRHITLHNNITAFGENLGWKGNVANVRLDQDPRFEGFAALLRRSDQTTRGQVANYLAWKFAASRTEPKTLPPVGSDVLTFARAKLLLHALISTQSEGMIPQFLVAALISILRGRQGIRVETHHPHAADKFDQCAGDIEEFASDGQVRAAYEVTVRPDWKNRLPDFRDKMDRHGLAKYVIIAGDVNSDDELAVPARLVTFLKPLGRDLAVVDINDFLHVFAAELTADELQRAVNKGYDFLSQPKLCGRQDIMDLYRSVVEDWLPE